MLGSLSPRCSRYYLLPTVAYLLFFARMKQDVSFSTWRSETPVVPKHLAVQVPDIYITAENAADDPSVETCKVATEILYTNPPTSKRNR